MNSVKDIEAAVSKLSPKDLSSFRTWFEDFDAEAWDRQFEQDAREGRLNGLAEEALRDLDAGRCADL